MSQVTSYSLSLHEIDTVVNSKGIPEPSAMEIMVRYEGSRRSKKSMCSEAPGVATGSTGVCEEEGEAGMQAGGKEKEGKKKSQKEEQEEEEEIRRGRRWSV